MWRRRIEDDDDDNEDVERWSEMELSNNMRNSEAQCLHHSFLSQSLMMTELI